MPHLSFKCNVENIVITELRIRFLPPDLTLVQSEMVVLGVLGYSRTQHAEWYDEGVLSVSGHCHLGQMISKTFYTNIVGHREDIIPPTSPKCHEIIPLNNLTYTTRPCNLYFTDQSWRVDISVLIIYST